MDSRHIEAIAIDNAVFSVVDSTKLSSLVAWTSLLLSALVEVEPLARVKHEKLGIVVRHGVVSAEVVHVALVLSLDVGLAEVLRAIGVLERAVERLADVGGNIIREHALDVGSALHVLVVVSEHDTVFGSLHVALKVVGAHLTSPTPRSLGLFGSPEDRATVCCNSIQRHIITHLSHFGSQLRNLNSAGIGVLIGELLLVGARSCQGSEQ